MNNEKSTNKTEPNAPIEGLGWMIGGLAIATIVGWAVVVLAGLLGHGHVPPVGPAIGLVSLLRVLGSGHWSDPAAAYPPDVRGSLPGPVLWWLSAMVVIGLTATLVAAFLRHVEPEIARERLGRRSFDWRGARPRPWARYRDLRTGRSTPEGFSLGRLDGRPVFADEEAHVVVIAPTRAGKTTRCVIPWLLEHDGLAIVTSTNRDVIVATREARERRGTTYIYDPFGTESLSWSPLAGCERWSGALRQAQWLADASSDGDSEIARYWRGEAAKLLAPLLHAAALGQRDMATVLAWVDAQETRTVTTILNAAKADAAREQLRAITELDPRNRGTTYMSTGSVLAAYRYPEVQETDEAGFAPDRFLASAADTLFLVAEDRHQQLVAPLLVALLAALLHEAIESGAFRDGDRRLRLLLDEAANVAPLADLPRTMSQVAGHGIRVATVWQSLAQMHERYGRGADTIIANSTAKLYLGPITDDATRKHVAGALASRSDAKDDHGATARALQQLVGDRALLISGARAPAVTTLRPFWR
ncbi:MAG TPA: type IV secretory system conjugative DNA transfer family protein [Baekduia sp.]|uniref:type IV secretory system conjugative DNA transfer family protein n=1 Tax=Baekduia sp. TaxID=2600305 RepID=UPI002D7974A8|nr:type IV secretory system conjugative DNA transfer family protein [Baekduia sp.]HET6507389.1 type IV secretory system conjugative DNA transfer family protein [Baekduia sp.]